MEQTQQEVKHTPGPWHWGPSFGDGEGWEVCIFPDAEGADALASVFGETADQAEANASLIAAAPRLKAVNEALLKAAKRLCTENNPDDDQPPSVSAWAQAWDAIALAEAQP